MDGFNTGGAISYDLTHSGSYPSMPTSRTIEFVIKAANSTAIDDVELNGNNIPIYNSETAYQNNMPAVYYNETSNDSPKAKFTWNNSNTNLTFFLNTFGIDNSSAEDLVIYPNPAKDKVNIQLSESLNSWSSLKLYSMNGQEVHNFSNSDMSRTSSRLTLDLPKNISNGVYILKINGEKGKRSAQLMIFR